uniref:TATA-box binding protein n=1 Tax=viral metagenome TaxID=1070528 RepID=A0A6C0H634_9ZZZZ
MTIETEWLKFLEQNDANNVAHNEEKYGSINRLASACISASVNDNISDNVSASACASVIPEQNFTKNCSNIYISTKTKILFLNKSLDIFTTFWLLPITDYNKQEKGIIKKQIKFSFENRDEYEKMIAQSLNVGNLHNKIITHIDNEKKFKHIRKLSIGLCKKDLLYSRNKDKSAFYNCFVLSLRIYITNGFKEIHIKIFNTGKIEIPGIQNDEQLNIIINDLLAILNKYIDSELTCNYKITENVLINSNFHCGFYINREILYSILRNKYNINAIYDPCSYPGIRCIYYCSDKNVKISYMIFRTGSILIVGKCDEATLNVVYEYIKNILSLEYENIFTEGSKIKQIANKKNKKKFILIQ